MQVELGGTREEAPSFPRVMCLVGPLDLGISFKRKLQDLYISLYKSLLKQVEIFCVFLPLIETVI